MLSRSGLSVLTPSGVRWTWTAGRCELTAREFELLAFLMHAPGGVSTREQIYEGVWGYSYLGDSKVIDFFVCRFARS